MKPAIGVGIWLAMVGLLLWPDAGDAQRGGMRQRWIDRMAQRQTEALPSGAQDMAYGADPRQHLDFWRAKTPASATPLVVFVHGGGWKRGDMRNATGAAKVGHFLDQGHAFASVNYRLVPEATVEQQAQDVADAIAFLMKRARTLGFDSRRVVLMGHSAGAHLAALVGTDMRYLEKAGLAPESLAGVVPLDGAAYDAGRQIAEGGKFMHDSYVQAFGMDAARQRALSPTFQAARPNAPAFLVLHVDRADGTAQSEGLAAALRKAGTPVEVQGFEGRGLRGHTEINRRLGEPDYPATPVVDAWIRRIVAAR